MISIPLFDTTEAFTLHEYIVLGSNWGNSKAVAGMFGCSILLEQNIADLHCLNEISEVEGTTLVASSNTFVSYR